MTTTVKQLLMEARDWLADHPDSWTTEFYAEDKDGNPIDVFDNSAHKFCARGVLRRFSNKPWDVESTLYVEAEQLLCRAASQLFNADGFDKVNDDPDLGYTAVLNCFDWAIAHS